MNIVDSRDEVDAWRRLAKEQYVGWGMTDGTAEDWQAISAHFLDHGSRLTERVIDHLRLLSDDHGGFAQFVVDGVPLGGGVALWWRNRSSGSDEAWSSAGAAGPVETSGTGSGPCFSHQNRFSTLAK